ncbi:AAA family ATPase [Candidatus Leptofilum sp.]|uniref:AAA family ATPase n=1 Tax=Candidatus Leptofilum sp. TaxID=3241576 RepID=UPI003B5C5137
MLKVSLLGAANISLDGQDIPLTGRPLALLAYLLLTHQPHKRLLLARLFHEESENPQARFRWTLNKLKQNIGARYLISDRQTVSFNFESDFKFDVNQLNQGMTNVYSGELLAGLHLNRALNFMNWLLFQREACRRQAESLLVNELNASFQAEDWNQVITTSHRLLQLDNLREDWLLPLLRAHEHNGNIEQAIQLYDSYRTTLRDELDLSPGPELQQISFRLQTKMQASHTLKKGSLKLPEPSFLQTLSNQNENTFIGREKQLVQLLSPLQQVIEKKEGQVCFVKGSAGSGKSSLIREVVRQATDQYEDILVAYGRGTSIDGGGSSYQPFIDVLFVLISNNLEAVIRDNFLPHKQVRRLWQAVAKIRDIVNSNGPNLVKSWLPDQENADDFVSDHNTQHYLFQQLTSVLITISREYPLVICLDNLQWSDKSSISLLFHLGQRLAGYRIFIICAFREESAHLQVNSSLPQTIYEIQRRTSSTPINLDNLDDEENRNFTNLFLDKEPNQYSKQFRQAFFEQTNGHPLFVIELFNALKADGALFQSNGGGWRDQNDISWARLPTRVEAVIETRVNKLSEELQQILSVAAVEGEYFTIQLISQIAGYSNRGLLKLLTPLSTQHPPFIQQGNAHAEGAFMQMRFSQQLLQQFFYQRINPSELILLHSEIAETLEILYSKSSNSIAAKLAYHFEKANLFMPAINYYQIAAETAVSQFANEDAITYFTKALHLLSDNDRMMQADFLLARERLHDLLGNRNEQAQDLYTLHTIANQMRKPQLTAIYLLRQAKLAFNQSNFNQAAHLSLEIIKHQNAPSEVLLSANQLLGQINLYQGHTIEAKNYLDKSMKLAEAITSIGTEATIFRSFSLISSMQGELTLARSYLEKARSIDHHTQSLIGEAKVLQNICSLEHRKGNYQIALHHGQQALNTFQRAGFRQGEGQILQEIGDLYRSIGGQRQAIIYQQQARQHFRILGDPTGEAISLGYLGKLLYQKQNYKDAFFFANQAAAQMAMLNLNWHHCWALVLLAKILLQQNNLQEAAKKIEEVTLVWTSLNIPSTHLGIQAIKADLALLNGDTESAVANVQSSQKHLNARNLDWSADPFYIYAVFYKVLKKVNVSQAEQLLETAYQTLQSTAQKIELTVNKNDFLEKNPSHKEIVTYYHQSQEEKNENNK